MAKETFTNHNGEEIVVHASGFGSSEEAAKKAAYDNACEVEKHQKIEFVVDAINMRKPFFRMTYPCKDQAGKLTGRFACKYCENRGVPEEMLVNKPKVKTTKARKTKAKVA